MSKLQINLAEPLSPIIIPERYNYIAVFLTLSCNLGCSYCINSYGTLHSQRVLLTGADWARGLNRIISRPDLPMTLQGGEPSLHPEFNAIIKGINAPLELDLLTNLQFDIDRFMAAVPPERLKRAAPYASIRVSYHPEVMEIEPLAARVRRMLDADYSVGIWGVLHPDRVREVEQAAKYCTALGIDFRTKEFLGEYEGVMYGQFAYPPACDGERHPDVTCRTSELLIGPSGDVYRCHADLYAGRAPVGNILAPDFLLDDCFKECSFFGKCNPCDVKLKTDRFQQFGHTSVEILQADDPDAAK